MVSIKKYKIIQATLRNKYLLRNKKNANRYISLSYYEPQYQLKKKKLFW